MVSTVPDWGWDCLHARTLVWLPGWNGLRAASKVVSLLPAAVAVKQIREGLAGARPLA